MTVVVKELDQEAREALENMCSGMFLCGECYAFAIALHRGTGWPMVGLMTQVETVLREFDEDENAFLYPKGEVVFHVAIRRPDGMLQDARGIFPEREIGEPLYVPSPYNLKEVSEDELRAVRPVGEHSITRARRFAEVLWPDLPWKDDERAQMTTFAEELEKLCRKHGYWIHSMFPGSPPILARSQCDEGGYVLRPTHDGNAFTIDRFLNGSF